MKDESVCIRKLNRAGWKQFGEIEPSKLRVDDKWGAISVGESNEELKRWIFGKHGYIIDSNELKCFIYAELHQSTYTRLQITINFLLITCKILHQSSLIMFIIYNISHTHSERVFFVVFFIVFLRKINGVCIVVVVMLTSL